MSANRKLSIVRTQVDPKDVVRLEAICEQRGMTQVAVLSRLVKWLAHQDHEVQRGILNAPNGDGATESTRKLLRKFASYK
jgi:hypothetical protein